VTSRAHVVLWPEGAVYFDSEADRHKKLEWVKGNATINGATIGVSFTEPAPSEGDRQLHGKTRNGIALVNKDGVIFEYYKRHLVPRMFLFPLKYLIY
jgi:apolipoprotein N-acyltransferase